MRILLAEDDAVSCLLLEETLQHWGYEITVATNGLAAWRELQAPDAPRLAILDWMMPRMDGLEICRELRKLTDRPYTYVLLLTAKGTKQDMVQGLESGADDYLTKPVDPAELKARLGAGQRILDLQDKLLAAQEALRHLATRDPLTSLWNHGAIMEILERELARGQREGSPVGVIMGDLDHFKRINDTHGHMVGDAVLREAAQRMREVLRSYDMIGRYGGEEFLIVLPACDAATTTALAERIRESIAQMIIDPSDQALPVTISFGTTASDQVQAVDAGRLLRTADAALYRAKHAGRNRVVASGVLLAAEA